MTTERYRKLRRFDRFAHADDPGPGGETHGYIVTELDLLKGTSEGGIYIPMNETTIRIEKSYTHEIYELCVGWRPLKAEFAKAYEQRWIELNRRRQEA